jgi:hypothetical protein
LIKIIKKSITDLFDKNIFFTALIPMAISALFISGFFYLFHELLTLISTYVIDHIPFLSDTNSIKEKLDHIGGWYGYYQLLIMTSMVFVGLISDKITDRVNEKYYKLKKIGFGSLQGSIFVSLKQNLIFIILLILFIPTVFIPILNVATSVALWMVLIKKTLFYDSIAFYATKDEYKRLFKEDKNQTRIFTLIGATLFLIPFLGVFVYVIQLLIFTHFNMERLGKYRG